MMRVIDASLAANWLIPDESNDGAERVLDSLRLGRGLVPSLFWFELRNLLLVAERRSRLKSGEASAAMAEIRALPLSDDDAGNDAYILHLARRHGLSAYDAAYLALALSRGMPLATSDRRLAEAGRAERVSIEGPFG